MPFARGLGERVVHAGAKADHGVRRNAEFHGNRVGRREADATDIVGKPIGVFRHDLQGIVPVGLVDPERPRGADTVAVKEDHDFANRLLFSPRLDDSLDTLWSNASDVLESLRFCLDDVEQSIAKGTDQLAGVDLANPPHHPGCKVLLDAISRGRGRQSHEAGTELPTVVAVVLPGTACGQPFSRCDRGGPTDDGDRIAQAPDLGPDHAKAAVLAVKEDVFDDAGNHLFFPIPFVHQLPFGSLVTERLTNRTL